MDRGRIWWGVLSLVSLLSSAAVISSGYRYSPIQVDGGWASYAGHAISEDREPYLHQADPEDGEGVRGVKAFFFWDTVSNTRALYTSFWYRIAGSTWRAVKALGVLEFVVLMVVGAVFFRTLLPTPQLALLATLLLMTDKMVVVMTATTFRPDVIQAAMGCAFYLALRHVRGGALATLALLVFAALAGMMSATAVTPIGIAAAFRGAEVLWGDEGSRTRPLVQLSLTVLVAAGAYLSRQSLFPVLLGSERSAEDPVGATTRIAEVWAGGPAAILAKEAARFDSYFLMSNVPLLMALVLGACLWLHRSAWRVPRKGVPIWAAVLAAVVILMLVDPHPRPQHLVPAMPFLLLLIARVDDWTGPHRRFAVDTLITLVVLSSLIGFATATRMADSARAVGYSNGWLEETLADLSRGQAETVVAGGTEFWSAWPPDADVTIVDVTRSPQSMGLLEPALPRLDYAVLSADYLPMEWIARVEDTYGIQLRVLVDKHPYVVIADGFNPPAPTSIEPRP